MSTPLRWRGRHVDDEHPAETLCQVFPRSSTVVVVLRGKMLTADGTRSPIYGFSIFGPCRPQDGDGDSGPLYDACQITDDDFASGERVGAPARLVDYTTLVARVRQPEHYAAHGVEAWHGKRSTPLITREARSALLSAQKLVEGLAAQLHGDPRALVSQLIYSNG